MTEFFGKTAAGARTGADVRVDEEGKLKYQQILDLLLAGGYFRARIQGLSPFDKVIGGMAWAITNAAGDLDIDIFFQENAQIGQKIKLGEQILDGLKRLGCKLPLQAYQIQGLDFASIFPVIQWLITKVMEVRSETGDLVRAYSEAQFSKSHKTPSDIAFETSKPLATKFVSQVVDGYKPRRQFMRRVDGRRVAESEEVALVLLEYGTRGVGSATTSSSSSSSSSSSTSSDKKGKRDDAADEEAARRDEAAYQERMARLAALGDSAALSQSAMAGFMPSSALSALLESYESGLADADGPIAGAQGRRLAEKQHENRVAALQKQVASIKEEGKRLNAAHAAASAAHEQLVQQCEERRAFAQRLRDAIDALNAQETPENAPILRQLEKLVALHDRLATDESAFRRRCGEELKRLKARVAELDEQARQATGEGADAQREAMLADVEAKDAKKRAQLERALAERRCALALVERKLDAVPSSAELQQYQRQFVELYEQIAAREVETRRYINTYNTLDDARSFAEKECAIYNSILEKYKMAMSTKANRADLVKSMQDIVKSLGDNLQKVASRLENETTTRNALQTQVKTLVDRERAYFKLAKDFQAACALNESLEARIVAANPAAANSVVVADGE